MALENQVTFAEVGNPKRVTQLTENTDAAGAYFLTEKVGESAAKKTSYATVESAVKSKVQSEYLQALSASPASDKAMSEKLAVGELKKRDDKIVQLEQNLIKSTKDLPNAFIKKFIMNVPTSNINRIYKIYHMMYRSVQDGANIFRIGEYTSGSMVHFMDIWWNELDANGYGKFYKGDTSVEVLLDLELMKQIGWYLNDTSVDGTNGAFTICTTNIDFENSTKFALKSELSEVGKYFVPSTKQMPSGLVKSFRFHVPENKKNSIYKIWAIMYRSPEDGANIFRIARYDNGIKTDVGDVWWNQLNADGYGVFYMDDCVLEVQLDLTIMTTLGWYINDTSSAGNNGAIRILPYYDNVQQYYNSSLRNKKVLWLGTSIPAGGRYPELSCLAVGAKCTNKALGSSRVSQGLPTDKSEGNRRCLTHTFAEKQQLFPGDDLAYNSSWEARLKPYLDYDVFVFDHGYNDRDVAFMPNVKPDALTDKSRTNYVGAMNYLVDIIYAHNPKARIVMIGHYTDKDRDDMEASRVVDYQTHFAKAHNFDILETWNKTGWSNYIIGGKTVIDQWLPDRVHLESDTTGKATDLYTAIVTSFLTTI